MSQAVLLCSNCFCFDVSRVREFPIDRMLEAGKKPSEIREVVMSKLVREVMPK